METTYEGNDDCSIDSNEDHSARRSLGRLSEEGMPMQCSKQGILTNVDRDWPKNPQGGVETIYEEYLGTVAGLNT